jgi:hypothetical protein
MSEKDIDEYMKEHGIKPLAETMTPAELEAREKRIAENNLISACDEGPEIMTCPWCGAQYPNWDFEGEATCDKCGHTFEVNRIVTVQFFTRRS